jgi:DNA invertase Pin-like site-specific DNA recombinase/DNA-directed RNA polymerase subunit RPC12/RpoP
MIQWEFLCRECGHTFEVTPSPDEEDVDLEVACPVCESMDTVRTYEVESVTVKEDLREEDPEDAVPPAWAAYVRVSHAAQAGLESLEAQREAIYAWATHNDCTVRWYEDVGLSDKERRIEPQFRSLMADLNKCNLAGIVVSAFDRLDRDAVELLLLSRDLKAHGKELVSLSEGDQQFAAALNADTQLTPDSWSALANFDRRLANKKMRDGYQRYLANGGKVGRKPIEMDWKAIDGLIESGLSAAAISRLVGLNENTARTHIRRRKAKLAGSKKPAKAPVTPTTPHPVRHPDNAHRPLSANGEARLEKLDLKFRGDGGIRQGSRGESGVSSKFWRVVGSVVLGLILLWAMLQRCGTP